jgi:hypothetical protein
MMLVSMDNFGDFIRDGAYSDRRHWHVLAPPPSGADEVLRRAQWRWSERRQPVVNITWFEADAFCRWRGGRLPLATEVRQRRGAFPAAEQPGEWCLDFYYPGAEGPYVQPLQPIRMRVEGWAVDECLAPVMSHRSIGFSLEMKPIAGRQL